MALYRKWCENAELSYKNGGILQFIENLRTRSSDSVKSSARIRLAFPVQTYIVEKHKLAWLENATRIVYGDLRQAGIE